MREPVPPFTISCVFSGDSRTVGHSGAMKRMVELLGRQGSEITGIRDANGAAVEMRNGEPVFKIRRSSNCG